MSTPAIVGRERTLFGIFGAHTETHQRASAADMAEMLREGVRVDEIGQAYGLARGTVVGRLTDAGWSSGTGQPRDTFTEPEVKPPQASFLFIDQPWAEDALCAQTDPEMFFPDKGGSTRDAKKVCAGCNVRAECLTYALTTNERFGIWGGLSERERRKLNTTHRTIACTVGDCPAMFANNGGLQRHINARHRPPRNPVTCPTCGRIFAHAGAIFHHAKTCQTKVAS